MVSSRGSFVRRNSQPGTDKLRPEKGLDHPTNSGKMGRTGDRDRTHDPEKLVISIDGNRRSPQRCQSQASLGHGFTESIHVEAPEHLVPEVLQKSEGVVGTSSCIWPDNPSREPDLRGERRDQELRHSAQETKPWRCGAKRQVKDDARDGGAQHLEASPWHILGLHQLQHRGQESAGVVSSNGERLYMHKAMGQVADIFTEAVLEKLPGIWRSDIRATRTAGDSAVLNGAADHGGLQQRHDCHRAQWQPGQCMKIRSRLEAQGSISRPLSDTEVSFASDRAVEGDTLPKRCVTLCAALKGHFM